MRSISWTIVVAVCCLLCCSHNPSSRFLPASNHNFEPRNDDYRIDVLSDMPTGDYVLLGHIECRAYMLEDALPCLIKNAQEHGGDISVDSTAGAGTTVTVTLPIDQP